MYTLFDAATATGQYHGYLWLIAAVTLLFFELNTPGLFFFIAFALGACISSICAFADMSMTTQCLAGLAASLLFFWIIKKTFAAGSASQRAKTNIEALVGARGIVTEVIKPHHAGQVKVRGQFWSAQTDDNASLQPSTYIKVVRIQGNRLVVNPLKDA